MEFFRTISTIKSCATALLNVCYTVNFNAEDVLEIKAIEKILLDMAKKYNPEFFKPIE